MKLLTKIYYDTTRISALCFIAIVSIVRPRPRASQSTLTVVEHYVIHHTQSVGKIKADSSKGIKVDAGVIATEFRKEVQEKVVELQSLGEGMDS